MGENSVGGVMCTVWEEEAWCAVDGALGAKRASGAVKLSRGAGARAQALVG